MKKILYWFCLNMRDLFEQIPVFTGTTSFAGMTCSAGAKASKLAFASCAGRAGRFCRSLILILIGILLLSACTSDNTKTSNETTKPNRTTAEGEPPAPANTTPVDDPTTKTATPTLTLEQQNQVQQLEEEFTKAKAEVFANMDQLTQTVEASYPLLETDVPFKQTEGPKTASEYYNQHIESEVQRILKEKYTPEELALVQNNQVQKPTPVTLADIPYQFKAKDKDFLNLAQKLYIKIYNASPYHEQGQIARKLALLVLETADEQMSLGKTTLSKLAYDTSYALMLNINPALFEKSYLPHKENLQKYGQSVYAGLSGKHFLTGRELTNFERADFINHGFYIAHTESTNQISSFASPAKLRALIETLCPTTPIESGQLICLTTY